MKRRSLIVAVGAATALTAGCLSRSSGEEPAATDESTDTTDATATAEPTGTGTDSGPTDTVTPSDSDTRFDDVGCPSFDESDRTVCYHTATDGSPAVFVEPSTELFEPTTGDDAVETVEFVLHNRADEPFGMNPHAWSLHERTDDGWSFVAPEEHVEPWTEVPGGETYTWHLSVEQHAGPMSEDSMALVEDLTSGVYAFAITGFTGSDDDRTGVECIALFEVQRGK